MNTKQTIILEGLPNVGKTYLANMLKERYSAIIVPEILPDIYKKYDMKHEANQQVFRDNDMQKLLLALKSNKLVIMDRSGISTLAYSLTQKTINQECNQDINNTKKWFTKNWLPFYNLSNVTVIYLRGNSREWHDDIDNPYGSKKNLDILENITIDIIKNIKKSGYIINYDYNNSQDLQKVFELIDRIINANI